MEIKSLINSITELPSRLPLRVVLIVPLLLLMGAVGVVGYLSFRNGQKAINDVTAHLRDEIVRQIEEELNTFTTAAHTVNRLNAIAIARGDINIADVRGEHNFWQQVEVFPTVTFIYCGDKEGNLLGAGKIGGRKLQSWVSNSSTQYIPHYYSLNAEGNRTQEVEKDSKPFDPRVRPWYKAAVAAGQPTWSDIYLVVPTFDPAIAASLPIYDPQNNALIGVCATDVFLPQQLSQFLKGLNIGKTGDVFIVERSGHLVATSADEPMVIGSGEDTRRLFADQSSNSIIQATAQHLRDRFGDLNQIQASEQFDFSINSERQLVQVTPFSDGYGLDWLIVTVIPEADYLGQIQENIQNTLLLYSVALLAALIFWILTARWITSPVLRLNRSAKAIAKGEWSQTVGVKRSDELGELANSFNQMAQQLQTAFAEMQTLNQTLAQNETRLKAFLDAIPLGIVIVDTAGRPYYFNQRATQLLGKGPIPSATLDQLVETYQAYVAGTNQKYPTEELTLFRALKGECTRTDNLEIHQDNTIIPVEIWGTPVFDEQGNVVYAIAAFQDITERKQAEKLLADYNRTLEQQVAERTAALQQSEAELRDREQELRLITDALPACISYIDANQRHRFVNRTYEVWLSCSRDEILGRSVCELLGNTVYPMVEPYINQALAGQTATYEAELFLPSGKKYISATLIPDFDVNAQVIGFYALNTDISDRKRAEKASILEERNRMAREIHDTLAQAFTGILIHMGTVSRLVTTNPEAIQAHINTVRNLARSGLAEARRSVAALRPQLLEDGNLWTALEKLVSTMSSSTETRLVCQIVGTPYGLPPETENNLLRIGQEAFTNAIKYANASEIQIRLTYKLEQCCLQIKDNGQGFEVNDTILRQGFGLLGITERVKHIGAQLSIASQPGQGTEVTVSVHREVSSVPN